MSGNEISDKVKGLVLDVEHSATTDGPGIRTVVFLKGCPLRCIWCHNPESWSFRPETVDDTVHGGKKTYGKERTVADVLEELLRDKPFYDASGGGMTLSGGEPLAQARFAAALLKAAKEAGVRTAVETCGHLPRTVLEDVRPSVDLWLYDIKGLDAELHRKHTGVDNRLILENLRWLDGQGAKIVLRCPMVPGLNDSEENLSKLGALADSLKGVSQVDVEPYSPFGVDKGRQLGYAVYEAPLPPPEYAAGIIRRLSSLTRKKVARG